MKSIKINIGGSDREFRFGLGFLGELLDKTGVSINEIESHINRNPFKVIPEMMFYSASFAKKRKGESVDFTVYDVSDWIDDEGGFDCDAVRVFLESFTESMSKDNPGGDSNQKADVKKK